MSVTGPIYWDKTAETFPSQSGSPVAITQTGFEDCCCAAPCTDCGSGITQNTATVSVSGTCDSGCDSVEGTDYDWCRFDDSETDYCLWVWGKAEFWYSGLTNCSLVPLYLRYYPDTGVYEAYLNGNGEYCYGDGAGGYKDVTEHVWCDPTTGQLSGSFDLSGDDSCIFDCRGCTATVTF